MFKISKEKGWKTLVKKTIEKENHDKPWQGRSVIYINYMLKQNQ